MNFQMKMLTVISAAVIVSMLLVFTLTGWNAAKTVRTFLHVSDQQLAEQVKKEALEGISSSAQALESRFYLILLRLRMISLLRETHAIPLTPDGVPDLAAAVDQIEQIPGMAGTETLELDEILFFGLYKGKMFQVFCRDGNSKTEPLKRIPPELANFAEHQIKDNGALIIPKKNTGYIWAAYYSSGENSHAVAAYRISIRKYLKMTNTSSGVSCSMLVFGNREIGSCDELYLSTDVSPRIKSGMVDLGARLVALQNSRSADEETIMNILPDKAHQSWEAAAATLRVRTVPSRSLRLVKAVPFPRLSASKEVPATDRVMVVEFFIILAGALIFFPPLILITRKMAVSLKRLLNMAQNIAKGEQPDENGVDSCVEMRGLASALAHLSDKLSGMQMRLKKSHEREMLARNAAEASNRMKSILLKEMVTELLEPLNLIAGFSGLLIRKFKHQSDAEAVLRKINDEALEVNRMVRSLKDLSALDLSETEPSYTEFEIDEIITKLRADSIALSSEKHIQFEIHCSELPGRIVSDKTIFFSILKLAIDTLLFHAPPKSKLVIQSQNSDNWIEFQISDTENPQIPSVAQIFNEHEKAPGTAYIPPGYGTALLNLAVLCAKARLIGAAFEAASTETANSVFTIRFLKNSVSDYSGPDGGVQAAGSEQSEAGSRTRISLSPLLSKTRKIYLSADRVPEILIADTSGNAVTMLSMLLENENYKTSSASSPEEVLGKLKEHHYDMLLLDLNLQRGLCTVLLETIRSKVSDSLVILTLSAELTQAEETSLRESGADRCLVKPVRVEALADAIRDLTVS